MDELQVLEKNDFIPCPKPLKDRYSKAVLQELISSWISTLRTVQITSRRQLLETGHASPFTMCNSRSQ
jgi:hypothetical protein